MTRPHIFQRPPARPTPPAQALPEALAIQVRQARLMQERGAMRDAAEVYRAVLKLYPEQIDCLHYLGTAEHHFGQIDEAVRLLRRAATLAPGQVAIHVNLGAALLAQGEPAQALAVLDRALALKEASAQAHSNRGWALHLLGRQEEAAEALQRAVALRADQPRMHQRLSQVMLALGRHAEALAALRACVELQPGDVHALSNLGIQLDLMGRAAESREVLEQALAIEPDDLRLRLQHASAWIPRLWDTDDELPASMARCSEELAALRPRIATCPPEAACKAAGEALPYYLAYQDGNQRELIARFGQCSTELMDRWQSAQPSARGPAPRPGDAPRPQRVRVGIVSAHVRSHSVWHAIVRGWVQALDRTRYELVIFSLEDTCDAQTDWARAQVETFIAGPKDLAGWVEAIRQAACDVLLYSEIGMHAQTARLASLRLAPLQAASWGHPQTTGLPTLDAYLSADAMEPAQAQAHYTEALVRLPGLGCHFEPPEAPVAPEGAAAATDLPELQAPYFVCPGMPFKYTPRHDAIWVRLAQQLPDCRLVFFREPISSALSDRLHSRLAGAFARAGLDASQHVKLLPWQPAHRFQALLNGAVAMLDTVGFSGFNTVMHAVSSGVPVISLEGDFLRGRLGSAILRQLDLPVARNDADYVARAVQLTRQPALRAAEIARMTQGRDALYRDLAPIRALEEWIDRTLDMQRPGAVY